MTGLRLKLTNEWAISSAGVLKTSAGVRLAYAEYNGVSPPMRKTAYAEYATFTPDELLPGAKK